MYLSILGPLRLRLDAGDVHIGGGRRRKILARLALNANRPVSVTRLIDTLWPDSPPTTAREQVQNCVGWLRKQWQPVAPRIEIVHRTGAFQLRIPDEMVDAARFRRLFAEAEGLVSAGDYRSASDTFTRAISLWKGCVLEDVGLDPSDAELVNLTESRVAAITSYVDLVMNHLPESIDAVFVAKLSSWARQMPYHEGIHYALIQALRRVGRSADAIGVVHEFRARLHTELGITPSRKLLELVSPTSELEGLYLSELHLILQETMGRIAAALDLLEPNLRRD